MQQVRACRHIPAALLAPPHPRTHTPEHVFEPTTSPSHSVRQLHSACRTAAPRLAPAHTPLLPVVTGRRGTHRHSGATCTRCSRSLLPTTTASEPHLARGLPMLPRGHSLQYDTHSARQGVLQTLSRRAALLQGAALPQATITLTAGCGHSTPRPFQHPTHTPQRPPPSTTALAPG
jgi:hypothetical protein